VAAHDEFTTLDQVRAELLVRRYRLLGSAEEAEDVVQEPGLRALLDRFAAAFQDGDVTALAPLLREDVTLEMPPLATWFSGREAVLGYVASNLQPTAGRIRLVPAAANGQPAFAAYLRDAGGAYRAHAMIVLTLSGALITRIVIFLEPALFRLFGLASELAPGESGDCRWSTSLGPPRGHAFGSGSDVQVPPSLADLRITAPALVWPPRCSPESHVSREGLASHSAHISARRPAS
jgi:hypothetical protein